ncbi:MAG: hypothetical protein HOP22_05290 [Nitrospiraceae bacterium]|nr:hypothetical protein [Nitrospiraceae bacterium]
MAAHMRFSIFYRQPAPTNQAVIVQAPHQRTAAATLAAICASSCDDDPVFRPPAIPSNAPAVHSDPVQVGLHNLEAG